MFKDQVIRFRCSPDQRTMVESLAQGEGKTLSEFLLGLCYREQARRVQAVTTPDEFDEWYNNLLNDPKRDKACEEILAEIKDIKIGDAVII